ncbi:MAG TPA: hypothetical protein PK765_02850 [bacterium]|nr:hypothetical protein [bacterium]
MRSYLASADPETLDDALREITPAEIAELVSGIPDDDIRHTLMRYGASIESDREAALERIKGEYSLVPADFQTIRGFIATASREDLTAMAKNKAARKRVIQTKAHVNLEGRDRNIASILDEIGLNQVSKPLNDTDKALIRRLMYPGGGDVRFVSSADVKRLFQILDFTNAANRNAKSRKALRNLFRAYCPMIRTGTLRKSGLLTPETVRSIREAIIRHQPGDMEATFGSYIMGINLTEEEIVRHDSIAIPFDQIADSTIDRLIDAENSDLFEAIAKDLTDERKPDQPHESGELGERDPHDWLIESEDERPGRDNSSVPESLGLYEYLNDHGQLVPRLAARIKKLFPHVTGTERIGDDTFVMGKIRDKKTGKESSVYIQIHEAFSG